MIVPKESGAYVSGTFGSLIEQIQGVGEVLRQDAHVVINRNITSRAWLTGYYIVEYEQYGRDRAKYGDKDRKSVV